MFTRWQTQYTEREDAKMCSKQDLSNFVTYHIGNDTQGSWEFIHNLLYIHVDCSIWFRNQMIVLV